MSCTETTPADGQAAYAGASWPPWFAVRVKSRHEKLVSRSLRNRNYVQFLPLYLGRHRHAGSYRDVELPLFPGYVFCRFNPFDRLPIISTPGVVGIVGFGHRMAPVDDAEIAAIQRIVEFKAGVQPWPFLRIGETVVLEEGPLRGLTGLLVDFRGRERLVVSVLLLQRSVAVDIDRRWVRPLTGRSFAKP